MYLEKIQKKQDALYQMGFKESVPCTKEEISSLEEWVGHPFPLAYREFLLWMGHWGGGLFVGSDCFYETLKDLQEWTRTLLEEDENPVQLPEDAFTFFMHQGYLFFYFRLSEGEDPPIYYYIEDEENPQKSTVIRKNAHFSDWLDENIDADLKAAVVLAEQVQKRAETDPKGAQAFEESLKRLNTYHPKQKDQG